jgi:hypothetical protein
MASTSPAVTDRLNSILGRRNSLGLRDLTDEELSELKESLEQSFERRSLALLNPRLSEEMRLDVSVSGPGPRDFNPCSLDVTEFRPGSPVLPESIGQMANDLVEREVHNGDLAGFERQIVGRHEVNMDIWRVNQVTFAMSNDVHNPNLVALRYFVVAVEEILRTNPTRRLDANIVWEGVGVVGTLTILIWREEGGPGSPGTP